MARNWTDIVDYDTAVDLLSTDQQPCLGIRGNNARADLDKLTAEQCDTFAHQAWLCASSPQYFVAYKSAAAHKRTA